MCSLFKIRSKYLFKNVLDYIPFKEAISILKYNKKALNSLGFTQEDMKIFLLMKKVIKPIANIEDYIPILKKSLNYEKDNDEKQEYLINLFCQYLNNNNKFVPNINFFDNYKNIYLLLNKMKITFNNNLIESFFDGEEYFYEINKYKLFEYANLFGGKIKEVSFLDSYFEYDFEDSDAEENIINNAFIIINFLMQFSNITKIEDRYDEDDEETRFLTIFNSGNEIEKYFKDYKVEYKVDRNLKDINVIIKELKSYLIYFDIYSSEMIKSVCHNILYNGHNIEELEITEIKQSESIDFINCLKNLKKLNSLIIPKMSDDHDLYNKIAEITAENSLQKLEINIFSFDDAYNIINKNIMSLKVLTIKINKNEDNNIILVKTLSKIKNISKLKIICSFPIIDNKNIEYLSLNKVVNLEISLNINEDLFDFNLFFKKIPNLKNLHFHGINFINYKLKNDFKNMKFEVNSIKKLKFSYVNEIGSFFISMFIQNYPKKENIINLSIENCIFNNKKLFLNFINSISLYSSLLSLKIDYLSFPKVKNNSKIIINNLEKLKNIEKISFLGWNWSNLDMYSYDFIEFIINNNKYLFDFGISCNDLCSEEINAIFCKLKDLRYLTKVKFLKNHDIRLYNINLGEIYYDFMIDIRNINFYLKYIYGDSLSYQPKIKIYDYFNIIDLNIKKKEKYNININTKKEEFYIYQNIHSYYIIAKKLYIDFYDYNYDDEDENNEYLYKIYNESDCIIF